MPKHYSLRARTSAARHTHSKGERDVRILIGTRIQILLIYIYIYIYVNDNTSTNNTTNSTTTTTTTDNNIRSQILLGPLVGSGRGRTALRPLVNFSSFSRVFLTKPLTSKNSTVPSSWSKARRGAVGAYTASLLLLSLSSLLLLLQYV